MEEKRKDDIKKVLASKNESVIKLLYESLEEDELVFFITEVFT